MVCIKFEEIVNRCGKNMLSGLPIAWVNRHLGNFIKNSIAIFETCNIMLLPWSIIMLFSFILWLLGMAY